MSKYTNIKWKFMKLNGVLNRKYKVSNMGDVVRTKNMEPLTQRNMCKKSANNGSDYQAVYISGMKSVVRVHRIVCETFHGKAPTGRNQVDHIDEYKDNNTAANLRWVSDSENKKAYRQNNPPVRYSLSKISTVKKLVNKGWTNDRIAQKVSMSDSNVSSIKLGNIHSEVKPYIIEQLG